MKASLRSNVVDLSSSKPSSSKVVKGKAVAIPISFTSDDDDFVCVPPKSKPPVKKSSVSSKKSKVPLKKRKLPLKKSKAPLGITFRNPSSRIYDVYLSLNENQKSVVKDIGFGFMENFVIKSFNRDICEWVLRNYDADRKVLNVGNQKIFVTRKSVRDMLGLPMGDISMNVPLKTKRSNDVIKKWKDQFNEEDKLRIRLKHIIPILELSEECDKVFVLNFLVAYVSIMIDAPSCGTLNQKFLENFGDEEFSVKDMDWCSFVIDCLNKSRKGLNFECNKQYTGPVSFLVLLYLHSTKTSSETIVKEFPATSYWTQKLLSDRLKLVEQNGGFANVEVIRSYQDSLDGIAVANSNQCDSDQEDQDHVPLATVMRNKRKNKKEKEKFVGQVQNMDQSKLSEVPVLTEKMNVHKDSAVLNMDHSGDIPVNDQVKESGLPAYISQFDVVLDASRSLREFTLNIESSLNSYSKAKFDTDDWIRRGWVQYPGSEEILKLAVQRNLEFVRDIDELVLMGGPVNNEGEGVAPVDLGINDPKSKDAVFDHCYVPDMDHVGAAGAVEPDMDHVGTAGAVEPDMDHVGAAGAVEPDMDHLGLDEVDNVNRQINMVVAEVQNYGHDELEGAIFDLSQPSLTQLLIDANNVTLSQILNDPCLNDVPIIDNGTLTQYLGDPSFCDRLEKDAIATISKQKLSVESGKVADDEFKTPKDQKPLNMSTEKTHQDEIICPIPLQSFSPLDVAPGPSRPKRVIKPAAPLCSPYERREVDTFEKIDPDENRVAGSLFLATRNPREKVFESKEGFVGMRVVMESLIPHCRIHIGVIDLWSSFLNLLETSKDDRTAPSRFFMPCTLMNKIVYKKSESLNFVFVERIQAYLKKIPNVFNLSSIDVILFPILRREHYSLVVFDLVRGKLDIIDNDKRSGGVPAKFRVYADTLKTLFKQYLQFSMHPRVNCFKTMKMERLEFEWQTIDNDSDCGVFLMRHMEVYRGGGADKLQADIIEESTSQKSQLKELRKKYAAKIILSDHNLCKSGFEETLEEYDDLSKYRKTALYKQKHVKEVEERVQAIGVL